MFGSTIPKLAALPYMFQLVIFKYYDFVWIVSWKITISWWWGNIILRVRSYGPPSTPRIYFGKSSWPRKLTMNWHSHSRDFYPAPLLRDKAGSIRFSGGIWKVGTPGGQEMGGRGNASRTMTFFSVENTKSVNLVLTPYRNSGSSSRSSNFQ